MVPLPWPPPADSLKEGLFLSLLGYFPDCRLLVDQMGFNNFEPHWGEGEGLIFCLSGRVFFRGLFQCLHTIGKGVFDKLQKTMLKPILEAMVSVIFLIYITQKYHSSNFSQQDHCAQDNFLSPTRWRHSWQSSNASFSPP